MAVFDYPRDLIWKDYLSEQSKAHGARLSVPLLLHLLDMYAKPGFNILDPMGGVGTILIALTKGCNVYMIELEQHFYNIAELNRRKIEEEHDTTGTVGIIINGDARKILPLPIPIDLILFSPPYGDAEKKSDPAEKRLVAEMFGGGIAQGYGEHEANIGNLPWDTQKWEMEKIYQKCYDTLKPGGRMIVVTKDIIKAGKRVEIGNGTIKLCVDRVGFQLEDKHIRLCKPSGMQNLHRKNPNYKPILEEDVFVFVKE